MGLYLETPVAFIIFNRRDTTEKVFAEIAKAKPRKLFVIADGPRSDKPGDAEKCSAARDVIARVDWDCEVMKNYSDVNLGCGHRPASGINWVFEHVEDAIILEDDCVPHPSFFPFCAELLEKYRQDTRVMHIGGSYFLNNPIPASYSYYFSVFNIANGGWATWRRAWRYFDLQCKLWPILKDTRWLSHLEDDDRARRFWAREFETAHREKGDVSYWDHQWTFACWANSGLSILPKKNLTSNIGFHEDATHTFDPNDLRAHFPTEEMEFPLKHPPSVLQSRADDRLALNQVILPGMYQRLSFRRRLLRKCLILTLKLLRRLN
jgi:hypothetical protein